MEEKKESKMNDPVNHPSHYTQGKIECIDFIMDKKLNFCRGNAVKYIVRAGLKDPTKEVEDLKKAIFYLNAEIKEIEGNVTQQMTGK
ncbi:MAG: DUF3310 domain-containing protein [Acidaminococcaceae bacterium]|nr:DUF3310 domain-containing protein [Acidaminococcaceae bacterium]